MTPARTAPLKLMGVLAHRDDESLGIGGTLTKYAGEGIETYLVTATRGERGRFGESGEKPPPDVVGRVREAELREAGGLGVREVNFLDYYDGDLDKVNVTEAIARIADHLRRVKPPVVITFGPEGAYGHPDHIAISQLTTAAVVAAARENGSSQPHRVSKPVLHRVERTEMGGLSNRATRPDLQSGWYRAKVVAMARLGHHDSHGHQSALGDNLASRLVSQDTDQHIQKPFIRPETQSDLGNTGVLSRVQSREWPHNTNPARLVRTRMRTPRIIAAQFR